MLPAFVFHVEMFKTWQMMIPYGNSGPNIHIKPHMYSFDTQVYMHEQIYIPSYRTEITPFLRPQYVDERALESVTES